MNEPNADSCNRLVMADCGPRSGQDKSSWLGDIADLSKPHFQPENGQDRFCSMRTYRP